MEGSQEVHVTKPRGKRRYSPSLRRWNGPKLLVNGSSARGFPPLCQSSSQCLHTGQHRAGWGLIGQDRGRVWHYFCSSLFSVCLFVADLNSDHNQCYVLAISSHGLNSGDHVSTDGAARLGREALNVTAAGANRNLTARFQRCATIKFRWQRMESLISRSSHVSSSSVTKNEMLFSANCSIESCRIGRGSIHFLENLNSCVSSIFYRASLIRIGFIAVISSTPFTTAL